jgi:hypothetical protein
MVNGLALLGWNPPHRSDEVVEKPGVFSKHEVLTMQDLLTMVLYIYPHIAFSLISKKLGSQELNLAKTNLNTSIQCTLETALTLIMTKTQQTLGELCLLNNCQNIYMKKLKVWKSKE